MRERVLKYLRKQFGKEMVETAWGHLWENPMYLRAVTTSMLSQEGKLTPEEAHASRLKKAHLVYRQQKALERKGEQK